MELQKSIVSFNLHNQKVEFPIYHNLPERFGNSLRGAVTNWSVRTNFYTPESLVEYINSKGSHTAMTEEQYEIISKLGT